MKGHRTKFEFLLYLETYLKLSTLDDIQFRGSQTPVSFLYEDLSGEDLPFIHLHNGFPLYGGLQFVEKQ